MTIRLYLVESWRHAWKWMSIQCAVVLGVLLSLQASLKDSAGDLAALTQSRYWSIGMTALAVLTILLRLVRQQPIEAPPAPAAAAVAVVLQSPVVVLPDAVPISRVVPSIPEGVVPMNANFTAAFDLLPLLVKAVQAPTNVNPDGTPLTGEQKTAAVLVGAAAAVPDSLSPVIPEMKLAINALVAMFGTFHALFQKAPAP